MTKLVLASNNAGKLREFSRLLSQKGFDVVNQGSLGVPEADEPHVTFIENALAKARHASRITGLPALADDSGVCVVALGGAPGVYSARFAAMASGGDKSDAANNALLIERLKDASDRRAYYYAALVLVRSADDPQPLIGEGLWWGEIVAEPRGEGGFGYDAHFLLPELGKTAAELTSEEKNRVSHRAQALAVLMDKLDAF